MRQYSQGFNYLVIHTSYDKLNLTLKFTSKNE